MDTYKIGFYSLIKQIKLQKIYLFYSFKYNSDVSIITEEIIIFVISRRPLKLLYNGMCNI